MPRSRLGIALLAQGVLPDGGLSCPQYSAMGRAFGRPRQWLVAQGCSHPTMPFARSSLRPRPLAQGDACGGPSGWPSAIPHSSRFLLNRQYWKLGYRKSISKRVFAVRC